MAAEEHLMRSLRLVVVASVAVGSCTPATPKSQLPAFAEATPAITVAQGYAEEATLEVVGGSAPAIVFVRPDAVFDDLIVGFIASGSEDDPVELAANARRTVRLSVTSPDATKTSYQVPVGLYTLTSADADLSTATRVASSTIALTVRFPVVSLSVTRLREDPRTLAQTWRVTNHGDDLSDLTIQGRGSAASLLDVQPWMEHVALAKAEAMEFEVVPQLFPGMRGLTAELEVIAGNATPIVVPVSFTLPVGKDVYLGMGGSVGARKAGGSFCTNQGRVLQEFGKAPRKAPKNVSPDFWSKQGMASAYRQGTGEGMAAGKALSRATGSKHLNAPMAMLDFLFGKIADAIGRDPPDPNFTELARPFFHTPPTYGPDPAQGLTQAGADVLSGITFNGFLIWDLGQAASRTLDKLEGARLAGDTAWATKHAIAYRSYAAMLVERTRVHAQLLRTFEPLAPEAWTAAPTEDQVRAMQAVLMTSGFTVDEQADFQRAGLSMADLDAMKAAILAADPAKAATVTLASRPDRLWTGTEDAPLDLGRVFELAAVEAALRPVTHAELVVRFELQPARCPIAPHSTDVSFNGVTLATLTDKTPEGLYRFPVDPSAVRFFGAEAEWNELGLESRDINTGSFVRALDMTLLVEDTVHGVLVVATNQAEADGIAGNLPTRNHDAVDLTLFANRFPHLDRQKLADGDVVQLPLTVQNVGVATSGQVTVAVFAEDPRLGAPGQPVVGPLTVAPLAPWATADLTVPVSGALLKGSLYFSVKEPTGTDYDKENDVFALFPEQACE